MAKQKISNHIGDEYASSLSFFGTCSRALKFAFQTAPGLSFSLICTGIISGLIPFGLSKVTQYLIDAAISISTGKPLIISFAVLIAVWAIFRFANDISGDVDGYVRVKWRYLMQNTTEILFLTKSVEIDIARHESAEFKNFTQRAFNRSYHVLTELNGFIIGASKDIIQFAVGAAIAINFDWKISVLLLITQVPSFISSLVFGRRIWGIWDRTSDENRKMQHYRDHLRGTIGITQSKLFQNSKKLLSMTKTILDDTEEQFSKTEFKRLLWETIATAIRNIGYVVAIIAIINSVRIGAITVGEMTFLIGAIFSFSSAIGTILSDIGIINEWSLYVRDTLTYLDLKPYMPKPLNPVKLKLTEPPTIKLENIVFAYHGSKKPTLQIPNLVINPGEKIAIVGLNGAGKTTLMRLLTHIENPTKGKITVNGVDLKNVEPQDWQKYLAVLPQNYVSYDFGLIDSIAFSDTGRKINRREVEEALRESDALGFVSKWEKGMNSVLGRENRGVEPSKGQHQKLAIARVLYRNAPVLILDEPTAAVDSDSRMAISNSLAELPAEKTLICISHDFAAVRRFARILVLKDGKLIEDGSHPELLKKNGEYARMYSEQAMALVHDLGELKAAGVMV